MCVSTSTLAPSSAAIASSSPSASSCAARSDSLPSTSRSSETASLSLEFVDRHMMDGERAVARNHHHAIEHALVVERDRIGGDGRLRARHLSADRAAICILERAHAVERQGAADGDRRDR